MPSASWRAVSASSRPEPSPCCRSMSGSARAARDKSWRSRRPDSRPAVRRRRRRSPARRRKIALGRRAATRASAAAASRSCAIDGCGDRAGAHRRRAPPRSRRRTPQGSLLTPTCPRRIAASNAARGKGSAPEPASAPNSTALTTLPVASASAAMSKATSCRAASRQAANSAAASARPSASAIFSVIANTRWVEAISSVLSGRDEAALDRARRLHQLGGEHHVDVARHRHQRQHRLAPGRLRGDLGKQLDVVDGRAGALRDARAPRSSARDSRRAARDRRSSRRARRRLRRRARGRRW